jgi:MinD superfamily P-loop ATPase
VEQVTGEIDEVTGRSVENNDDPNCDHCSEARWSVLFTLTGEFTKTRKLCTGCTVEFLEWV